MAKDGRVTAGSMDGKSDGVKKSKRGRPGSPKYQESIRIDANPEAVARAIMKGPPKPDGEWRYLKNKVC